MTPVGFSGVEMFFKAVGLPRLDSENLLYSLTLLNYLFKVGKNVSEILFPVITLRSDKKQDVHCVSGLCRSTSTFTGLLALAWSANFKRKVLDATI